MTGDTVGARAWRSLRSMLSDSWDRLRDLTHFHDRLFRRQQR